MTDAITLLIEIVRQPDGLPSFQKGETYEVHAIEVTQDGHDCRTHAWVKGVGFADRLKEGAAFPDLLPVGPCTALHGAVPPHWKLSLHHYPSGWRLILGPPCFTARDFLLG